MKQNGETRYRKRRPPSRSSTAASVRALRRLSSSIARWQHRSQSRGCQGRLSRRISVFVHYKRRRGNPNSGGLKDCWLGKKISPANPPTSLLPTLCRERGESRKAQGKTTTAGCRPDSTWAESFPPPRGVVGSALKNTFLKPKSDQSTSWLLNKPFAKIGICGVDTTQCKEQIITETGEQQNRIKTQKWQK